MFFIFLFLLMFFLLHQKNTGMIKAVRQQTIASLLEYQKAVRAVSSLIEHKAKLVQHVFCKEPLSMNFKMLGEDGHDDVHQDDYISLLEYHYIQDRLCVFGDWVEEKKVDYHYKITCIGMQMNRTVLYLMTFLTN